MCSAQNNMSSCRASNTMAEAAEPLGKEPTKFDGATETIDELSVISESEGMRKSNAKRAFGESEDVPSCSAKQPRFAPRLAS